MNRRWAFVAPLLIMSACQDEAPADEAGAGARVEGAVLGGTISDDMIPLGTLRSQSPPVRPSVDATGAESAENGEVGVAPPDPEASEEPAEATDEADAEPEPQ